MNIIIAISFILGIVSIAGLVRAAFHAAHEIICGGEK